MPHDPARVAEVRGWLQKAAEDLRAGRYGMTAAPPLASAALFHAQQAAEKSLKGFLVWHDRGFRKTHNLLEIGEACAATDPGLEHLLRLAAALTEYAWKVPLSGRIRRPTARGGRGRARSGDGGGQRHPGPPPARDAALTRRHVPMR
jgi:hypothetical protein